MRKPGMPLCRVPSTSPSPRRRKFFLGDAEAVIGFAQDRKPRFRRLAERAFVQQEANRTLGAAADAAAQLMKLRQAEPLGVLDHHHACLGHIDADFDHRGGNE